MPRTEPLFTMTPPDAAAYVRKLDRVLRSHASDFASGWDKENALAAFDAVIVTLLQFREHYPAEHANIDEVLRRHGYKGVLVDYPAALPLPTQTGS
jgi:methyl coenzyme M reductase subunit C-like uncharacterized protein (methanogenesis marker protein 7)